MRRLLIRPGAIGDFIVSLPALESLRSNYTEVWCAEQNVPLARFADAARSLVSAGLDRLGFLPSEEVIEKLRSFDSVVSWYGARRPEFRRLTSDLRLPFTFLDALPGSGRHATDFYNAQARELGGLNPSRYPAIACPPAPRTFAAIHPFASGPSKRAPMGMFQLAAARLAERMPVHWFAGPEDEMTDAIRFTDLYELACRLAQARIFVGNDSGISHLAASVGTPVFALFHSTRPGIWAPRGPAVNTANV